MKAKIVYGLIICGAAAVTVLMLSHQWGVAVSPLMKIFVLFFGLVLGYQAMPALLRCSILLKLVVKPVVEENINSKGLGRHR